MCLKSRSSTGTLGKRVLPLRGNLMRMEPIGSLSSTLKPHGLLQKGPPVDPSDLSGFTCESSYSSDESFDSNYKLFKNQNGEVFARYVSTNCRNGPPMKKIWVPKRCLESLQVNVIITPPVKNRNPRSSSSYGPKSSYGPNSSHGSNSSYVSRSSY